MEKQSGVHYTFMAAVWQHSAPSGWYFISLPIEISKEVRSHLRHEEEGWGRLKVTSQINKSRWQTAIWFDTKHSTYLLPLKASIRNKEKLDTGDQVEISIWI